jgi:uncharacterized protein YbcI
MGYAQGSFVWYVFSTSRAICLQRDERGILMVETDGLQGEPLLAAVTEAMVGMHEHYHGRRPASAKSLMMGDDLLACVMGDVYTDVERTLIDLQRSTIVQETRSAFQSVMQDRFIATVQRLSGRRVVAFISNQHVDPDLEIELFVFATAEGHDI